MRKIAFFAALSLLLMIPHFGTPTNKTYTQRIPGTTVEFEMVEIPAGKIALPNPENPDKMREIEVKRLWIGKTELTWDAYDIWAYRLDLTEEQRAEGIDAESRPSKPYGTPDRGFGHAGYAAIGMTYEAAVKFCEWLSQKTGKKYRLPTEAEWEYACRAGMWKREPLPEDQISKLAWHKENGQNKTHKTASKEPNAWGLYDVLGNVAEWAVSLDGKPVACGGSYKEPAAKVHPAARQTQAYAWNATDPQFPKSKWWLSDAPFVGFRIVCEE